MKLGRFQKLKSLVVPVVAAFLVSAGTVACSSSDESEFPDAAIGETVEGEGNVAMENGEGGNNIIENSASPANPSNAAGDELQNLVNDSSQDTFNNGALNNAALGNETGNAEAGADPFAANNTGADPSATDNTGADPFASNNAGADPFAANNTGADPFAPAAEGTAETVDNTMGGMPENPAATDLGAAAAPGGDFNASSDPAANADPFAAANTASDPFAATNNTGAADPFASENTTSSADPFEPAAQGNTAAAEPAPQTTTDTGAEATSVAGIPGSAPENGTKMPYYIQKGDTLASIAGKLFSNSSRWKELAEMNNLRDPSLIYAGDVIFYTVDNNSRSFAEKYEGAPRKQVTVQKGDTLSQIAARLFGNQHQWRTLWKENPHVKNPDLLSVGTVLTFRDTTSMAYSPEASQDEVALSNY